MSTVTDSSLGLIRDVDSAGGGTYTLLRKEGCLVLEQFEPARLPLVRTGAAVLFGGPILAAALYALHYAAGTTSSEVMYTLYAVTPCGHPVLGLLLAYVIARATETRSDAHEEIDLGDEVVFEGAPRGRLLRIDQDLAAASLTLVCEGGSKTLSCGQASDAVALANAIDEARAGEIA